MTAEAPRRRASEGVYDRLRELVLENRLPPDERISIDAVARELGVSQTPVREAIRQLEGDRLVVRVPGKGYQTTPLLDRNGLRDLFEFRLLVERSEERRVGKGGGAWGSAERARRRGGEARP